MGWEYKEGLILSSLFQGPETGALSRSGKAPSDEREEGGGNEYFVGLVGFQMEITERKGRPSTNSIVPGSFWPLGGRGWGQEQMPETADDRDY